MSAHDRAVAAHLETNGSHPTFVARAPGRVNLIGEHTDYNDGFVLPMALPFDIVVAGSPTMSDTVTVKSEGFGVASFDLAADPVDTPAWARYLHGMGAVLRDCGHAVGGWRGAIATDIPAGASLSSSAALEVAGGLAFVAAATGPGSPVEIDMVELALLGQRVENEVMGLPSGVMDQLASATAVAGCASLIDCRDLSMRPVPLPTGVCVMVIDTGTRRRLVESAYAERQATCARIASELGVTALRDARSSDLDRIGDELGQRRARHVVSENERTLAAAEAMERDDAVALGRLMSESHASLRDDYEVSGPALDLVVEIAAAGPGCLGARMTGGGFAGGAVALVEEGATDAFLTWVSDRYEAPPTQPAAEPCHLYVVTPSAGASISW